MNHDLTNIYFNPRHPAGFSSYQNMRKHTPKSIPNADIKKFLSSQESYTVHKQHNKKIKRDFFFVTNIDEIWQIDVIDFQKFKKINDGYKFILIAIDVLS